MTHVSRLYNTRSEAQGKLWALGDYDVTAGSLTATNAPLWRGCYSGVAVLVQEQEVYGKSLYLPLHFAVNLKLL